MPKLIANALLFQLGWLVCVFAGDGPWLLVVAAIIGVLCRFALRQYLASNLYHGGDAVFAARLDRDEEGRHTVDVFAMPRYDFTYKDGRTIKRAATSKFAKEQARARCQDLIEPGEKLHPDSPVMQGRALQAAWHEYLRDEVRLGEWVHPPNRKAVRTKDRLEPEELALKREKAKAEADAMMMRAGAEQEARTIRDKARGQVVLALEAVEARKAAVEARERAVERDAAIVAAARRAAGRPDADVEAIADRGRQRRGSGLER